MVPASASISTRAPTGTLSWLFTCPMFAPANAGTMVTMRNPWGASPRANGGQDTTHDGLLDVPVATEWSNTVDLRIISGGASAQ